MRVSAVAREVTLTTVPNATMRNTKDARALDRKYRAGRTEFVRVAVFMVFLQVVVII
jgi:hypothetical protein